MDIKEVVSNCLDQLSLGENEFSRIYRMAIRGIRKMKWSFIGTIDTVQINVLPNCTAPLPDNFMTLKKIGIMNDATGEIATFIENVNLGMYNADCGDRTMEPTGYGFRTDFTPIGDDDYLFNRNNDPYRRERQFSRFGSNVNLGEYRLDRERNLVVFSPGFKYKHFVLEYVRSTDCHGVCDIPEMVSEALIGFVLWQYKKDRKSYTSVEKRDAERYFYNENRKAKLMIGKITKSRMNQSSRQGVRQNKR